MDCDNARLFLPYLTPGGKDLDGAEADELRAHLAECSACNALAMNARRLDQHLGRAMRAVEVPVGMKARILERLADDRGVIKRRWRKRIGVYAGVAALLLFTVIGWYFWDKHRNEKVYTSVIVQSASVGGHSKEQANAAFGRLGAPNNLAPNFNYAYLFGEPALAELPGYEKRKVPQLTFIRQPTTITEQHKEPQVAIVYILPKGAYKLERDGLGDPTYRFKLAVNSDDPNCDYLILYNGDGYRWVELEERKEN
jgi:hypothetical protein